MPELKRCRGTNWRENLAAMAGIVLLGALVYANTLQVPWYLDDIRAIVENRSIQQLPTALDNLFASSRGLVDLTFALNYRVGKLDVTGYHLVNITIHLLTSCLLFLVLKRVFRRRLSLAAVGALIFVAHPLQTQAVTYIIQRTTSLAAFFFFLALYLYIRFREASKGKPARRGLLYGGALVCGALAVLIKQNTAVLPLAIVLFDRYFLKEERPLPWKRLLWHAAPFAIMPAGLAAKILLMPLFAGEGLSTVGGLPNLVHLRHSSPLNYFVTELSVVWIYLRLLVLPVGQALDYDLPIVASMWTWRNLLAALGVTGLLATAIFLRKRRPVISAGILWFFLGLAVESTFIPLDPVFEHRLYIPMFGFALVVTAGIACLPRKIALPGSILLVAVLAILSWQRNQLWNDPIAFYADNLRQAPRSERVHADLANAYRRQGQLNQAESLYQRALEINPDYVTIHINLSLVYMAQREFSKAESVLLEGLRRDPSYYELYNNLGVLYNRLGQFERAVSYLTEGVRLRPDNASMHFNLGLALERLNRLDEAVGHYRRSISLDGTNADTYFNLGMTLYRQGKLSASLQAFVDAARLDPGHAGSLYNAARIALQLGDTATARSLAEQLRQIKPDMAAEILGQMP